MKFIEAKRILADFEGGPPLEFLLAMSGQPEPIEPFLSAAAAERGYHASVRTLPFNTLAQALHSAGAPNEVEVFLLFPWDLVPEADWRSGFPQSPQDHENLLRKAHRTLDRITGRDGPSILYVDAPFPQLLVDQCLTRALSHHLIAAAAESGARILPTETFSMESLLRSGFPLASGSLGVVSREIINAALKSREPRGKVIVTDFDNTLWRGVVGEDGVGGLESSPTGAGFPHFIYQTFLKRLKSTGVLVAGVTRNDPDLARAPLESGDSVLRVDDFVSIIASYNPKSSQIRELAEQLNLGLDAFAFVDDNRVEIEEVRRTLPDVEVVLFPEKAAGLPPLFVRLSQFFHTDQVTAEDEDRTEMYRRRLAGLAPRDADAADLASFLKDLGMRLVVNDRSTGDRSRAVQLINKTNQFNLNGIRRSDSEVGSILESGGHLYTAYLEDRHGSHGEILTCLTAPGRRKPRILSLVMSCRVFQRRVEYAFLCWLANEMSGAVELEYLETERNEPIRRFLHDPNVKDDDGTWILDLSAFSESHGDDLSLFEVVPPASLRM